MILSVFKYHEEDTYIYIKILGEKSNRKDIELEIMRQLYIYLTRMHNESIVQEMKVSFSVFKTRFQLILNTCTMEIIVSRCLVSIYVEKNVESVINIRSRAMNAEHIFKKIYMYTCICNMYTLYIVTMINKRSKLFISNI